MTSHVFIQKIHYSLTSCQLYFLVPLSSFLAGLLALSHTVYTYVKINIKRTLPEEANALKALILWTEAKGSLVKQEKTLKVVK